MDVSVLATRGRKQMSEQNYNTANKLGFLFMCLLLGREVRLLSALYSHLCFIQFHFFHTGHLFLHFLNVCFPLYLIHFFFGYFWGFVFHLKMQNYPISLESQLLEKYPM